MKRITLALTLLAILPGISAAVQNPAPFDQWEPEIRKFEESDKQNPPKPGAILFIGSSSIRMWESLAQDFPSERVLNRGFGGSQIADSTHFVDRIVTVYRPKMIVFYAGDNDLAAGRSPEQVLEDFDAFVKRVRHDLPDVPIAFISIKPSLARANLFEQMRTANDNVREYAGQHQGVTFIDVFTPMLGKDGKVRGDLFGSDGLHMNRSGYEIWTTVIAPYLRK